jgi:hypothetical protein
MLSRKAVGMAQIQKTKNTFVQDSIKLNWAQIRLPTTN